MAKDYYKILDVERSASADEIKKAFRKKAMEHHPDRASDKVAAEAKFKEANEAYAVLSDPEKRQQYDRFGAEGFGRRFSQEDIFSNFDFGSVQDIFGGGGGGGDIFSKIFGGFGGFGGSGGASCGGGSCGCNHQTGGPPRGQDARSEITVGFEEAALGGERQITLQVPGQGTRSLKVKIPAGTRDGSKLRLKGQGAPAQAGGQAGDLYLEIKVAPDPRFRRRDEHDLEVDVTLPVLELILGGSVEVPTLRDGIKKVKIRPGTQPGTTIRLPGFGLPTIKKAGQGDLFALLRTVVPDQLSDEQKTLFEQLRESGL